MKHYLTIDSIDNPQEWVREAIALKRDPLIHKTLGRDKTVGLLFFNSSLRTRLSTHKAALNLGMHVMVMNIGKDGWILDFEVSDRSNPDETKFRFNVTLIGLGELGNTFFSSDEQNNN